MKPDGRLLWQPIMLRPLLFLAESWNTEVALYRRNCSTGRGTSEHPRVPRIRRHRDDADFTRAKNANYTHSPRDDSRAARSISSSTVRLIGS